MAGDLECLVWTLNDDGDGWDEARTALVHLGVDAARPMILSMLPRLERFGQFSAIQTLEELKDPRCGPALIELIDSEHDTVREWAALALGDLNSVEAIPPLRRRHEVCKQSPEELDGTEARALRQALTNLGARTPVLPALAASLRTPIGHVDDCWAPRVLARVFDNLADHAQLILHHKLWIRHDEQTVHWLQQSFEWDVTWGAAVARDGGGGTTVGSAGQQRRPPVRRGRLRHHRMDRPQ